MLTSLTRVGSDHSPLLLNSGENKIAKSRYFFFEKQWTQEMGFGEMIKEKWGAFKLKCPDNAYYLDVWHGGIANLGKFLRGWGANIRGEYKKKRKQILERIQEIDLRGENDNMGESLICERRTLEGELEKLMEEEESY
jgi:hypothetical protein